jgi:hypothetical protein
MLPRSPAKLCPAVSVINRWPLSPRLEMPACARPAMPSKSRFMMKLTTPLTASAP